MTFLPGWFHLTFFIALLLECCKFLPQLSLAKKLLVSVNWKAFLYHKLKVCK